MQTAKNLMDEISKIVRVVKPDMKLFVGDSLAGNDTINQAREFFQYTNFDGAILTKIDADAKGGAANFYSSYYIKTDSLHGNRSGV